MPLSWNEIKDRALTFSKEWEHETSEEAEAKSFWDGFFTIFGVPRRRVATFEQHVKKIDGKDGYIDLLWRGMILIEHKSRGKDLDRAYAQAKGYFPGIKDRDLPRYILVSDFARFRLYDLDTDEQYEFPIADLYKNIRLFGFIAGYQTQELKSQDPANIRAAELMGKLHDQLKTIGYHGHVLEVYLVRLLFCLFAEDTSIFERCQFQDYIEQKTAEDGHDLAHHLGTLFYILNTSPDSRLTNLDEHLAEFPYVNGKLFEEILPPASFDTGMRQALLNCCALDWSRISPAIFGSLFQSVMNAKARRNLGAHYTEEKNILKLIKPLFLDDLWVEFERLSNLKNYGKPMVEFHRKLSGLKFFDPACGCGNFLVIAYRELRLLELEILRALHKKKKTGFLSISEIIWLDVDQFYGIEIEEFPAQIAQVALWMTDHQMNMLVSEEFGQYFRRLPLTKAPNIVHGNALQLDWQAVAPDADYILGNPPFVGAKFLNDVQRAEVAAVFHDTKSAGLLDYVSCWYRKAAEYMTSRPATESAFVSTNSITQGEQVGVLWPDLMRLGVRINFVHRTFQWSSAARGKAAVHCVIVGFALHDAPRKAIFEYADIQGEPHAIAARHINAYLVDASNVVVVNHSRPICDVPSIGIGSQPIDDGNYLFTAEEKAAFLSKEPKAANFFHRWLGSVEFLNGYERWCLWLGDCPPHELRQMPEALKRVEAVRFFRQLSKRKQTLKAADIPTHFGTELIPAAPYLLMPKVSSERRSFIPFGFIQPDVFCSDLVFMLPNATLFHFGILSSTMHNAWMRTVCGRLKSDYRYSAGIVYNNFPWPDASDKQRQAIEAAAQGVLDARVKFSDTTLADLYDPLTMPPELTKAHQALDKVVDAAYGRKKFTSEAERVAFLFERYQALTAPLMKPEKASGKRRKQPQNRQ